MKKPEQPPARWYHQPILWLGAALFAASLAGCIWLIVVAQRYADTAVPTTEAVFKVPVAPSAEPVSPGAAPTAARAIPAGDPSAPVTSEPQP